MQQINLYQPILRKQEKVFSAKTLLQGNLLVLLGLLLLFGYTALQTRDMHTQLSQVQQQRDMQVKQLAELARQFPARGKDQELTQHLEKIRAQLQHKRELLAAVDDLGLEQESGFSQHLDGLARQDLPQLWLQRIYLQQGQQVELEGSAYQAEEVPLYLQRLAQEHIFNGTSFHSVEIARSEEHAGRVDFLVSTRVAEAKR